MVDLKIIKEWIDKGDDDFEFARIHHLYPPPEFDPISCEPVSQSHFSPSPSVCVHPCEAACPVKGTAYFTGAKNSLL